MSALRATEQVVTAPPVTDDLFRSVFRDHAAGVVVVTAPGDPEHPTPVGLTATSLTSLSMSPPLVSFAVSRASSAWPGLSLSSRLAVHFLGQDHGWLARRFATSGIDRFAAPVAWNWSRTGEPVLTDCAAYLSCRVDRHVPAGDHVLVIAEVTGADVADSGDPLLYHAGGYAALAPVPAAADRPQL